MVPMTMHGALELLASSPRCPAAARGHRVPGQCRARGGPWRCPGQRHFRKRCYPIVVAALLWGGAVKAAAAAIVTLQPVAATRVSQSNPSVACGATAEQLDNEDDGEGHICHLGSEDPSGGGDVCDPDDDDDGICDRGGPVPEGTLGAPPGGCREGPSGRDVCPIVPDPQQIDRDHNDIGLACDPAEAYLLSGDWLDDLIRLVNIALDNQPISACTAGDREFDRRITIDELVVAVRAALEGCFG